MTATPLYSVWKPPSNALVRFLGSLSAIQPYCILSNARAKTNTSAQEGSQSLGKEMKFIILVINQQIWSGDKSTALTGDSCGVFWYIFRGFFYVGLLL